MSQSEQGMNIAKREGLNVAGPILRTAFVISVFPAA